MTAVGRQRSSVSVSPPHPAARFSDHSTGRRRFAQRGGDGARVLRRPAEVNGRGRRRASCGWDGRLPAAPIRSGHDAGKRPPARKSGPMRDNQGIEADRRVRQPASSQAAPSSQTMVTVIASLTGRSGLTADGELTGTTSALADAFAEAV